MRLHWMLSSVLLLSGCISVPVGGFTLVSTEPLPDLGTRLEKVEGKAGAVTPRPMRDAVDDALWKSDADLLEDVTLFMELGGARASGIPVRLHGESNQ